MQPIHLGLPLILGYSFTTKIKHISRINNFDKYKIAINSPEMHFWYKETTCRSWSQKYNYF
jgi:hypothetical protein